MRPVLRPGLRVLRRDATTLQLGLEPCRAVLIDDCPEIHAVLAAMDGVRLEHEVVGAATAAHGISARAAEEMLTALRACGAVEDADDLIRAVSALPPPARQRLAPDVGALSLLAPQTVAGRGGIPAGVRESLRRRRGASVGVRGRTGPGRVAAQQLASAGIGSLVVQDATFGAELAEAAPWTSVHLWPSTVRVDAVLLLPGTNHGATEPQRQEADALLREGVPHLVATVQESTGRIGPFVLPGTTACLRCLDLTRADTDPTWPAVLEQLMAPTPPPLGGWAAADSALAALVGVWAAVEILALVHGLAVSTAGATVEVSLTGPSPQRRAWSPHPACGCRWDEAATMGA